MFEQKNFTNTNSLKIMKRIAFTFFMLLAVAFAYGQELAMNIKPENKLSPESAIFAWAATEFDFGRIKAGVPVSYEFEFTNDGEIPLVISTVQASCGCTVTSYTKEPIEPGGKGFVKATYNAASAGQFTKTVTVNANTEEGIAKLTIKGEVVVYE
jgi:hypothetical protein